MTMALHMVRCGTMSRRAAAKAYEVPVTTILDKLSGRGTETPTPLSRR